MWCFWHRCLIPCACYFHARFKPAVLISLSFDGELIARTIEQLGFLTARGSSTRSGGSGLWALAKAVERGHPAVFTADGPRGPVYKVKPGAVKLAQLTGYSIGIFYAHPEKAWMLRSWDRFLIPKPFSRVAISWGRNIEVPQSEDPLVIEAKRLEVEAGPGTRAPECRAALRSGDEHAVPVGEEAITRFDRVTIGGQCLIFSGKGAHQHQQRRLGQMKIGQQSPDHV